MQINLKELFLETKEKEEEIDFSVTSVENDSSTSEIYNARLDYKNNVNKNNFPLGLKNKKGKSLKNQIDTWYENNGYGKYDFKNRLIRFNQNPDLLKQIPGTELFSLNFVVDAINQFIIDCDKRKKHPNSSFNNIKIVKAYELPDNFKDHQEKLYEKFFADVLNEIKYTNKIKDYTDYLNLFYLWFLNEKTFATETGFYENVDFNIYNQGLAFDFFEVKSEADKETVLKDPRFAVINYCAKINGLRIDPNNPGRIIADIESVNLLEKHVKKYFKNKTNEEKVIAIIENYFDVVTLERKSIDLIVNALKSIGQMYLVFIRNYSSFISFNASSDLKQEYKKEFKTNKVNRDFLSDSLFFEETNGVRNINQYSVEIYAKIRAKERSVALSNAELNFVVKKMLKLINTNQKLKFSSNKNFTSSTLENQAINFLEGFLLNKKKTGPKRQFAFFWERGIKDLTGAKVDDTMLEQQSDMLNQADKNSFESEQKAKEAANLIGCKGTHKMENGLFMPCQSHEEYLAVISGQKNNGVTTENTTSNEPVSSQPTVITSQSGINIYGS